MTANRLPSNVVLLRPDLQSAATKPADLQTTATSRKTKKLSHGRGLQTPVSAFQVIDPADLSLPPANANPSILSIEDFRRLISGMTRMQLRERFTPEANCHRAIVGRCNSGAFVLDPEFKDFRRFLWHLGPRPAPSWSVDRLDYENPTYGPGLCRWASPRTQANNRGVTIMLTARGETLPLTTWAARVNEDPKVLAKRYERRWADVEVIYGRGAKDTPEPVEPEPVPIRTAHEWPEGVNVAGWEAGFLSLRQRRPDYVHPAVTRAVFLAWVLENAIRAAGVALRQAFPGYDETEYMDEPEGYADYPSHELIDKAKVRLRQGYQAINGDKEQLDVLRGMIRQWPHVRHPAMASKIKLIETESD